MSRSNKGQGTAVRNTWCWRRWIISHQLDVWTSRLRNMNGPGWALTERPNRPRILLEVYTEQRDVAHSLAERFGGRVRLLQAKEWFSPAPVAPTRIGKRLEIVHDNTAKQACAALPRLHIPHGMAFGSGDHATTHLLLGALTRWKSWKETTFLDLGTGSGILALAARLLGARKIVATDFDAES